MKSFFANLVSILTEQEAPIGIIAATIFYVTCLAISIVGLYVGPTASSTDAWFEIYGLAQFFTAIMTLMAIIIGAITGWEWLVCKWTKEWKPSIHQWGVKNSK